MSFNYSQEISSLIGEERLHFYELLAHNLTVSIRGIWLDKNISDTEKVDRIKLVNEILHRVTNKIWVLRLNTHEWTEEDTWQMINAYISDNENIRGEILFAIKCSLKAVKNLSAI
jgi:hypothetical protein